MALCLWIISSIKTAQQDFIAEAKADKTLKSNADQAKVQMISAGATVFVIVVNFLL
jgi:hypothetical protein